jgi:hypothetical protein
VLVPTPDGADAAPIPARLVIRRLDGGAARAARRQALKKAAKNGQRAGDKRLKAAEYIMLLTSLDADGFPAARVFELYRLRWQIEIAFKRLKGIVGLADLPAKDPRLAQARLYAKLIAAAIGDDILQGLLDSPPCAPDIPTFAMAPASTRLSRPSRPRPRTHRS